MDRCYHEAACFERTMGKGYRKVCLSCGLRTHSHETLPTVMAEWKVRLALDKRLHGDALSAQDEIVLAYGATSSVCGQNLV